MRRPRNPEDSGSASGGNAVGSVGDEGRDGEGRRRGGGSTHRIGSHEDLNRAEALQRSRQRVLARETSRETCLHLFPSKDFQQGSDHHHAGYAMEVLP